MAHVPHLLLPRPWAAELLEVAAATRSHLETVLRRADSAVTYTDGNGTFGSGCYHAGIVERGEETDVAASSPAVTLVVAAPHSSDRQRFVVEKAAELGVTELAWTTSKHSQARLPQHRKSEAWAVSALEQSRGSHLMVVREGAGLDRLGLGGLVLLCDRDGGPMPAPGERVTIVVGPEGGLADDEAAPDWIRVSLGPTILRTETAAIVAAAMALAVGRAASRD